MITDNLPIGLFFLISVLLVMASIELGFLLGSRVHRKSQDEKESIVSAITGSVLALLAFILAFTFGIVSNRFDARKALVRDEANAIGTAWLRADFLPEPDRTKSKQMFIDYVDLRLDILTHPISHAQEFLTKSTQIQNQLWAMAVDNARKDPGSEVSALYVKSLNEMIDIQSLRVAIGLKLRLPIAIWEILGSLIVLAMVAVGYQMAIAGSRRSWSILLLALSFSLIVTLISALDRPKSNFIPVPQDAMKDVRISISTPSDVH